MAQSLDIGKALEAMTRGAVRGLANAGKAVLDDARDNTPVRSGDLRDDAQMSPVRPTGNGIETVVSFGNSFPAQAYAVKEHEDMTAHHDDGGPKFLERAVNSNAARVGEVIAQAIRQELR